MKSLLAIMACGHNYKNWLVPCRPQPGDSPTGIAVFTYAHDAQAWIDDNMHLYPNVHFQIIEFKIGPFDSVENADIPQNYIFPDRWANI